MEAVAVDCSANVIHRAHCQSVKPLYRFGSGIFMDFSYHESKKYDTIKEKKNDGKNEKIKYGRKHGNPV